MTFVRITPIEICLFACVGLGKEPTFDVPVVNVTVVAGQTAVLPCLIDFLGNHMVKSCYSSL